MACKSWNEDQRGDKDLNPDLSWIETGRYAEPCEYENLPGSSGQQNFKEYSKYHMKENWRRVYTTEYGTRPPDIDVLNISISCNHCQEPACVKACPLGYIYKEQEYGIVRIDTSKTCIACQRCKQACPWDSPQYYDKDLTKYTADNPKRPRMTKCNLCIDRIKDGLKPACVASCIMRALDAGPIEELKRKYPDWTDEIEGFDNKNLEEINKNLKPNIIFKKKVRKA